MVVFLEYRKAGLAGGRPAFRVGDKQIAKVQALATGGSGLCGSVKVSGIMGFTG